MRVRLSIYRHELPSVDILWALPDEHTRPITVSQLLEDINNIVPLESGEWGLEDYVVQLGKFECLHFSTVQELLKEEDSIVCVGLLFTPSSKVLITLTVYVHCT